MTGPKIAIVGAGIGGLSLALQLQRHHINVTLFERSSALSSRGGTIRIDADTQDALTELDVMAEVEETGSCTGAHEKPAHAVD